MILREFKLIMQILADITIEAFFAQVELILKYCIKTESLLICIFCATKNEEVSFV